jgi:ParB/RepB/Spo0J family partition protein
MSTTQLVTPEVDIELIDVIDGYNTRTAMDPKRLAELAASIGDIGLREPLTVRPTEEGRYELIAGHRRHRAARMAGLTTVPVTVDPDADRRVATAENDHREDLDPIARAVSYRRLAEERNLKSNREIAAEANKSVKWVGEHLRLLKLPEQVRHHIAAGTVPTSAEPRLRKIAAVSPRIAECLCEVFARDDSDGGDFGRDFDQLIYSLADAVAQGEIKDPPTMIDPRHIRMSEVFDERDQLDELAARHRAAIGITGGSKADPVIALGEVELTVARAAGVLLEYEDTSGGFTYKITYLTDKAMAADLLKVAIEREEKDAQKREKEARKREKEFAQAQNSENGDASGAIAEERQRREAEREAAMKEIAERRKAARSYNERVGLALIKRRGAKNRKKFGLARAKAGAISLILHDRTLAAARPTSSPGWGPSSSTPKATPGCARCSVPSPRRSASPSASGRRPAPRSTTRSGAAASTRSPTRRSAPTSGPSPITRWPSVAFSAWS